LLCPLRPRLNVLRPPRRLRIRRLLFYPFDPLILPPKAWRPGMPAIPRSALGPIVTHVAAAIPEILAEVETRLAGRDTADKDLVRVAGTILWPAAARVIDPDRPPEGWRDTGMATAHYRALAPIVAAVLRQAPAIEALCQTSLPVLLPAPRERVQAVIRAVAADHPPALACLFGLLMMRLPEPSTVFALTRPEQGDRMVLAARSTAADLLLSRLDADGPDAWIAGGDLIEAAGVVRRLLTLLTELDRTTQAERRALCRSLCRRLDAAARDRFDAGLREGLLLLLDGSPLPDALVLEDAAFSLATFQAEAREVGGRAHYDAALAEMVARLDAVDWPSTAAGITRARLAEILGRYSAKAKPDSM
ncbi:MAG TPA: hypothetical protein VHB27_06785, partial [Rhodopila sp.]|uniref:hypothetical protein n=1 Tax=Rhodopila sp. TaxID=2480087 RepID=UPI002C2491D3